MTKVLCFGDSITYGYIPAGMGRYPFDVRYAGVLKNILGSEYEIYEDGFCGRTTAFDRTVSERYGLGKIRQAVRDSDPDVLVIMLGTNDCKAQFSLSPNDVGEGILKVAKAAVYEKNDIKILLVSPPIIEKEALNFTDNYTHYSLEVSAALPAVYKNTAEANGYTFVDASLYIKADKADGEHPNAEGHHVLAEKLAEVIREL